MTKTRIVGAALLAGFLAMVGLQPAQAETVDLESVAHRGDKEHYADNSLEGIESAIIKGADWVEIDLHYNRDGDTFFLAHDNICAGPGGIATIDIGSYENVVERCDLPELDDVIDIYYATGYGNFILEFKSTPLSVSEGPVRLVEEMEQSGLSQTSWISSLSDRALLNAQATGTSIPLMRVRLWTAGAIVTQHWLEETSAMGFQAANINLSAWTVDRVEYAESLGLVTSGWAWPDALKTHNEEAIDIGLDMFMTDRLDDLHERLGR